MKYKVHWIIDGVAELEASSKEDAEKIVQESLRNWVQQQPELLNELGARAIQGTAYLPGEIEQNKPT